MKRLLRRQSLRTRLVLSFTVVIVTTAGLIAVLSYLIVNNRFSYIILSTGHMLARQLAPTFADYYTRSGGWDGVETLMATYQDADLGGSRHISGPLQGRNPLRPSTLFQAQTATQIIEERLLLVDTNGKIIADSDPEGKSLHIQSGDLSKGAPVIVNRQRVGTLLVASSLGELLPSQRALLTDVNILMAVAAIVAVLAVFIVGWFQTRNILAPVRSLADAAYGIAGGDLSHRIPVTSQDELGEMASAFNTMSAALEQQQILRQRAMSDIAHELRTPLSVLKVNLEGIQDGVTAPTPKVMGRLLSDVDHLNCLIEDLRMLARVDAGEFKMDMMPVEMCDLVENVIERVRGAAKARDIALTTRLPDAAMPIVGDRQRLAQVLFNLLSNALCHTPPGGQIAVGACWVDQEVRVWVQDTGKGIPARDLPYVFERLYRVDQARSRETGGSGLGLAIARSLVEAHGGRIWAKSKQGVGSIFAFVIPVAAMHKREARSVANH